VAERTTQRLLNRWAKGTFNANWSISIIKEAGNKFHRNFTIGLKAHPLLYRRVNLGYWTKTQREAKARVVVLNEN
jgi:hypothetical protein